MNSCIQGKAALSIFNCLRCYRKAFKVLNRLMTGVIALLLVQFPALVQADNLTKAYCDLPLQETAIKGQMIKPYPVVALDLNSNEETVSWLETLEACGSETVYVIILSDTTNEHANCEDGGCFFDLFEVQSDPEGEDNDPHSLSWYEVHLSIHVIDDGGWAYKVVECPRSNDVVATGFYRISYLGGNYAAGAYDARTVMVNPVRAEATWGVVNESCFGFGELNIQSEE